MGIMIMKNNLLIEEIIECYIDNNSTFTYKEDKDRLKSKFLEDVKEEVIELEKQKIKNQSKIIKMEIEEQNRIKSIKILMYEGFFIAFLVGLIVNQFTDVIGITKGSDTNTGITLLWIIVLGIGTLLIYKFKYIHDVLGGRINKEE